MTGKIVPKQKNLPLLILELRIPGLSIIQHDLACHPRLLVAAPNRWQILNVNVAGKTRPRRFPNQRVSFFHQSCKHKHTQSLLGKFPAVRLFRGEDQRL